MFEDVSESDWFYPYVSYLSENGIVKGMTETQFVPGGTFTVAESAAIITRYLDLEDEAAKRKAAMEVLGVAGSDKWYAGYVQLMYEANIIDAEQYGCAVLGRHISIDDPSKLESPVKRYEFASFITRSFELDGTQIRTSATEDGLGHGFIYGSSYDESALNGFIPFIKDYYSIPQSYRYYVLKAYYNGIFCGDDFGSFNPENNLTRAEMAKVATVITDKSQRIRIDTSSASPVVRSGLPDDSYVVKDGEKYLKNSVSDAILSAELAGIVTENENGEPTVSYVRNSPAPEGYCFEICHYARQNDGFDKKLSDETNPDSYSGVFSSGDRIVLLLCDAQTGEAVDAYALKLVGVGNTVIDSCRYTP